MIVSYRDFHSKQELPMKILPHFVWDYINNAVFSIKKRIYHLKFSRRPFSLAPQKKVLVLACCGGIGNAVEATPLVQAVRILWPNCHLTFATVSGDLFWNWCVPDRVITDPEAVKGERFNYTFAAYLYEDLTAWKKYAELGKVHALNKWQKKWLLKPESEYYLGLLGSHGYKGGMPPCYVAVKKPAKLPPDTGRRICIAPCGKKEDMWKYKKWPYYTELIHALRDRCPDSQICIIGTKEDDIGVEFDDQNIVDYRSVYSLSETAWLLKNSDLVIGNDCGPMHIASAVNVPSIAIFGPTCVIKNAYSGKVFMAYPKNLKCWPCQYDASRMQNCTLGECINSISPQRVLECCIEMLT